MKKLTCVWRSMHAHCSSLFCLQNVFNIENVVHVRGMQPLTPDVRRPRTRAQKTTGIVVKTMNDALGIAEPLERYGELPACQIVGLYNAIHGLPTSSEHCRARLGRLFHESEGIIPARKLLIRPSYQWRHGYNHQTMYRCAPGTGLFLFSAGVYAEPMMRWASRTRIVPVGESPNHEPSIHDTGLSFVMSSIEIGVRRTPGFRFLTHLDIVKNASREAQEAQSPFSIPFPELAHTFPSGKQVSLKDVRVEPDALFGVRYPPDDDPDFDFFAIEYDRSTEDIEPSANLTRSSWLRKILSYSAISVGSRPIYQTYLKVPVLSILCLFSDTTRMAHAMELVARHTAVPEQFLFKTTSPIDPLTIRAPMQQLFSEPWQTIRGRRWINTSERR